MTHFNYLLIGGGMATRAAVSGIRELDEAGTIGIIAGEKGPMYDRPPLSKKLWTGQKTLPEIYHDVPDGVTLHSGRWAQSIDPEKKSVTDDLGREYTYDRLLLATGSTPRHLPFGPDEIIYYRTDDDYRELRKLAEAHDHFAVIGGGFIGSEVAAALAMEGKQVTLIFPDDTIGQRVYPADLAAFLNDYFREQGVEVLSTTAVTNITGSGTALKVVLDDGRSLAEEGVVAGIGVLINTELAEAAGLVVDNGVVVDERLQTSDPYIYAAGDIASFPDATLGERRRVEHEDAALSMGLAAGRIMAGSDETYDHFPMFYSDLFDLGYEAVGKLDSRMDIVSDWQEPYRKGVVYYLEDGRIRGVLLWDVWGKVDDARELIGSGRQFSPAELSGLIK